MNKLFMRALLVYVSYKDIGPLELVKFKCMISERVRKLRKSFNYYLDLAILVGTWRDKQAKDVKFIGWVGIYGTIN